MANLTDLPCELLPILLLYSHNPDLALINRTAYHALRPTPRLCYKFAREVGAWQLSATLSACLDRRFLSTRVIDEFRRNMHELHQSSASASDDFARHGVRIPARLFRDATRLDVIKALVIDIGVSVSGHRGVVGLLVSAQVGNARAVEFLVDQGVDATGGGANKPLMVAAVHGHLAVVKALVAAGAEPSAAVLRYAVMKRHADVAHWLVENGAAPDMDTIRMLDDNACK